MESELCANDELPSARYLDMQPTNGLLSIYSALNLGGVSEDEKLAVVFRIGLPGRFGKQLGFLASRRFGIHQDGRHSSGSSPIPAMALSQTRLRRDMVICLCFAVYEKPLDRQRSRAESFAYELPVVFCVPWVPRRHAGNRSRPADPIVGPDSQYDMGICRGADA